MTNCRQIRYHPRPEDQHLTPETLDVVRALREQQAALELIMLPGEAPPMPPTIILTLRRAIARLVLLDTRHEALKRRKPELARTPATAADSSGRP